MERLLLLSLVFLFACGGGTANVEVAHYVESPEEARRRAAAAAAANPPRCEIRIDRAQADTPYPSTFDFVGDEARTEIAEAFRESTGLPWMRLEVSIYGRIYQGMAYGRDMESADQYFGAPWSDEVLHRYALEFVREHVRRFDGRELPDASGCDSNTTLRFVPPDPLVLGEPLYVVRWVSGLEGPWNFNLETARIPPHARPAERSDEELTSALLPARALLFHRELASQAACVCDGNGCPPCAQEMDGPWERAPAGSPYPLWIEPTSLVWQRGTFQIVDAAQAHIEVRRVAYGPTLDPATVEAILGAPGSHPEWTYLLDTAVTEARVEAVTGELFEHPSCRPLSGGGGYSEWRCDTPMATTETEPRVAP